MEGEGWLRARLKMFVSKENCDLFSSVCVPNLFLFGDKVLGYNLVPELFLP